MSAKTAITAESALTALESCWDVPRLVAERPDVAAWIEGRVEIHFDMVSDVVLVDKRGGAVIWCGTNDVRVALAAWLRGGA